MEMRFPCKGVVATTHLALGVITILLPLFGLAVEAQAQVPNKPEIYSEYLAYGHLGVTVRSHGSVVRPTSYKLQWKSGDQDYDSSRQKIEPSSPYNSFVRATFWIHGLTNSVEYTFRAFATNEHGDSLPSFERTVTWSYPSDKDVRLWRLSYHYRFHAVSAYGDLLQHQGSAHGDLVQHQILGEAEEETVHNLVVRPSSELISIRAVPNYLGSPQEGIPGATVEYDPADADVTGYNQHTVYSHRVFLIEGENVITVTVTSADRSTTSTHTITVTRPSNSEPTGVPTIAGTARVGETLTASVSEIADADGLGGAMFTYQWIRSDGATDTEIADATQASYRLVPTDQGKTIKVRATFIDNGGTEVALTSAATAVVQDSLLLSVPQIDGVPQVGNTLEVSFAEPPSGALAYQWLRGLEVIAGATASTYVPTVADVGARLSVRVESGSDSVTSAATAPVWPAPANPPLADGEEELLSATVTLGANRFPFWVAGYGRVLGQSFGEMDVVSFEDGGATYAVDAFLVNSRGLFALATGSTVPDASGLVAYWNGYRISGLEADTANGGKLPMLVGRTPQPSTEYSRYEDGASDGVQVAVSLRRVSAEAQNALTASFENLPEAHDGESTFRFRVAFSEPIGISFRSLREDAFTVTGGRVTRGKRVDGRRDLFEITVEPDGTGDVAISLPAGRECSVSGAICTKGENRRQLTNTPTATVAGPAAVPLTASFIDMPAEHDEENAFRFRIAFSERVGWMNGRRLRENVVAVAGGRATSASRVNRRRDLWQVTVEPDSLADVTVTLSAGAACRTPAAVCTSDGRALSNTISATVRGPVALSVADARAEEGADETIDFAVSLSRAASGTVEVSYATADGTATAGEDYTRSGGTLSFDPGETEKTVRVPVLDDAVDEGEETFTLRLTNASGAVVADGEAIGTIENSDPLQKMWLSRFGRTVAGQVVDAVTGRLSGPTGGSRVTLGGQSIDLSSLSADSADARRSLAGALGAAEDDDPLAGPGPLEAARAGSWDNPETGGTVRSLTGRELLLGSSFHLAAGGPGFAAWGRMAVDGFDAKAPAEKGEVRLDGEVTTGVLGADAQWERWLAGLAFSVSSAEGAFDQPGVDSGTVESTLTSVNPYVRYEASDRLSAWGLLGYGTGDMTMTQAATQQRAETVTRTDLSMRLGAAGARGVLLEANETGGIDLALRGDAFLVQMESERAANTVETKAEASRLRLVLEGGRSFALGPGAVLTPALELGLRHDGGDAETGTGVELGGRIRYTDTASGLTVEANARTLIAHEDSGYEEWGAGGSVHIDPGASGRGLSLSLSPVWGTQSSGVDRLWSARDAAGLAPDGEFEAERRLEGELGYGFGAFGGRGLVTPYAGLGLAEAGDRTWRAGARWSLAPTLAMSLDGTRREPANDDAPEHGVQFGFTLRW